MTDATLVIKGRAWRNGAVRPTALEVDVASGRILTVADDLDGPREHDYGPALLLPGGVDPHVHFRDPGHPEKEDFTSGTLSALHGGVTTIYDMPNTDPATTTAEAFAAKQKMADAKAVIDWGIYGGCTAPGDDLAGVAKVAPGIKIYMGESTGCVTLEHPDMVGDVLAQLHELDHKGVVIVHAEHADILMQYGITEKNKVGLPGHAARRPVEAEEMALDTLTAALEQHREMLGEPPFRVHVAHVSSQSGMRRCREAGLSFGVTPNHLLLHHEMPLGAWGRMNPPLREPRDQAALFSALADGTIPIVESDHAPHTLAEKDKPVGEAPSGIPGVETLRPLLIAGVASGRVPLESVVRATAEAPADLLGLPKGRFEVGYDADIAVYDLDRVVPILGENLHSKAGWTPFQGWEGVFPTHVYLRGHLVLVKGEAPVPPGTGVEARTRPAVGVVTTP